MIDFTSTCNLRGEDEAITPTTGHAPLMGGSRQEGGGGGGRADKKQ